MTSAYTAATLGFQPGYYVLVRGTLQWSASHCYHVFYNKN